jgi:HEAT repeat protein
MNTIAPDTQDQISALIEARGYQDHRFYGPATTAILRMMPDARKHAREVVPPLIRHLTSCTYHARALQGTIIAVGAFGRDGRAAVPMLMELLKCERTDTYEVPAAIIRLQAARALGNIGPDADGAVPRLREALSDASAAVREAAHAALIRIEGRGRR